MALLARAAKRGDIEVFAFCVLSTHYHLLVRSVHGQLDRAMQRIQTDYSRYFNRTRRRDGPLVRGRFSSKRVDSALYFEAVRVYIDANPVEARLSQTAAAYQYGSAFHSRRRARWLEPPEHDDPATAPGRGLPEGESFAKLAEIVEGRLHHEGLERENVDELFGSTPGAVLTWMRRKAEIADGTSPGLPVCDPSTVLDVVAGNAASVQALSESRRLRPKTVLRVMTGGLLRDLCGLRIREIAARLVCTQATAGTLTQRHQALLYSRSEYAKAAARIACEALERSPLVSENWKESTDVRVQEEID